MGAMLKTIIFSVVFLCVLASGYGVYKYFDTYNRARNPDAPRPEVIVFASSSFIGPYGPGPQLEAEFEKICLCDVILKDPGGTELLFQKLQLAGAVVDVVVGLDQLSLKRAAQIVNWRPLKPTNRPWGQIFLENKYATFLPYDWSPMTFIFKK